MADFMRLPETDPDIQPPVPAETMPAGGLTVRTANANLGAIRVALPRRQDRILAMIQQSAQLFGDKWEYELPFAKKEGTNENVTGPTVKCCQEVARIWGNCNVDGEFSQETADAFIFTGIFVDLETGYRLSRPFRQRKQMKIGEFKGDTARKLDNVFLIGASKASRNVIANALPGLVEEALEAARRSLYDRIAKKPEEAREWIKEQLAVLEIELNRVTRLMGRPLEKCEVRQLAQLVRIVQSISDGQCTADEAFPPAEEEKKKPAETKEKPAKETKTGTMPASDPPPQQGGFGE